MCRHSTRNIGWRGRHRKLCRHTATFAEGLAAILSSCSQRGIAGRELQSAAAPNPICVDGWLLCCNDSESAVEGRLHTSDVLEAVHLSHIESMARQPVAGDRHATSSAMSWAAFSCTVAARPPPTAFCQKPPREALAAHGTLARRYRKTSTVMRYRRPAGAAGGTLPRRSRSAQATPPSASSRTWRPALDAAFRRYTRRVTASPPRRLRPPRKRGESRPRDGEQWPATQASNPIHSLAG